MVLYFSRNSKSSCDNIYQYIRLLTGLRLQKEQQQQHQQQRHDIHFCWLCVHAFHVIIELLKWKLNVNMPI